MRALRNREVADADESNFAHFNQPLDRRHGLPDGNRVVGPVQLVEIEVVSVHLLQAALGSFDHIVPAKVAGRNFAGEEDTFADSANCLTNHRLGPIRFRGINESGAKFNSGPQGFRASSILPRTECELGNLHSGVP